MKRVSEILRGAISAFRCDRRGNVAVIFAFAMIPLIGFVGASIDYSRANAMRTKLQDALDSTALMLSKKRRTTPVLCCRPMR
jgi:Flp pilus assembly protein TadG